MSWLTTTRIESNSIHVMGSLDGGNLTIKFNNTKLYTLSGTYNSYNSLYGRCLPFFVY